MKIFTKDLSVLYPKENSRRCCFRGVHVDPIQNVDTVDHTDRLNELEL